MPHLPGETPAGGPGDDVGIQPVQQVVVGQRASVHADCGSSSGAGRKCCRRVSGVGQLTCGQQVLAPGRPSNLDGAPAPAVRPCAGRRRARRAPPANGGAPSRRTIGGARLLSDLPASSTRCGAPVRVSGL